MCGICGVVDWAGGVERGVIERMCGAIAHRGPDHEGVWVSVGVGLGSRRLRIIDLQRGDQPLSSEDGRVHLVFNGEIYNYRDLRKQLKGMGHVFGTECDSEVVLHGYEQWGAEVVGRLVGEFALAVWDERESVLFLARDRLGVKPLYYSRDAGRFVFASEVKAILEATESRRVDVRGLLGYMNFGFVPGARTMFEGVSAVLPGHRMMVKPEGVIDEVYWDIPLLREAEGSNGRSLGQWVEEFRSVLAEAVADRLQADVPVGTLLSGGIDSSSVTALASRRRGEGIDAFTLGVMDESHPELNEVGYAREVARRYSVKHHVVEWERGFYGMLGDAMYHVESPVMGNFAIPLYLLSKQAREEGFKVLITGDGSDENLAGYTGFKELGLYRQFCAGGVPEKAIVERLRGIHPECLGAEMDLWRCMCLEREVHLEGTRLANYPRRLMFGGAIEGLLDGDVCRELKEYDLYGDLGVDRGTLEGVHWLNQAVYLENKMILANLWTTKVDAMCMANGVEARVAFMDHRVVEFLAKVPVELKLRGMTEKFLLREAMRGVLPESVRVRAKHGLQTPVMREPRMFLDEQRVEGLLGDEMVERCGLFGRGAVRELREKDGDGYLANAIGCVHLFCEVFGICA